MHVDGVATRRPRRDIHIHAPIHQCDAGSSQISQGVRVNIDPGARGRNVSLGPGRITSTGCDCESPARLGSSHTGDVGALNQTQGHLANLRKVHQWLLIDRVNVILKGSTVLVECTPKLEGEGGSTKLLERIIGGGSCGGVADSTRVVVPVLYLITDSGESITVRR